MGNLSSYPWIKVKIILGSKLYGSYQSMVPSPRALPWVYVLLVLSAEILVISGQRYWFN